MSKYAYPAVFEKEKSGGFSVYFPDLQGCYTQGDNIADAISNAEDVLNLWLYDLEEKCAEITPPSDIKSIETNDKEFVTMIACDTVEYRRYFDNKAVKKTLTIPNWLNTLSERSHINFSSVLQKALMEELHIEH